MEMDYEVEMLCQINSDRRRYAEELDWEIREQENREREIREREEMERAETDRIRNRNKWGRWGRAAKAVGQVHLAVSAVLALLGLPLWAGLGMAGAALCYLMCLEFRILEVRYGS